MDQFDFDDLEPFDPQAPTPKEAAEAAKKARTQPTGAVPVKGPEDRPVNPLLTSKYLRDKDVQVSGTQILSKVRNIFGLSKPQITYVPIKDPDTDEVLCTVGLRKIGHDDFEWSLMATIYTMQDLGDNIQSDLMWSLACLAIGIATMDDRALAEGEVGTPIWKAVGADIADPSLVKNAFYPQESVRFLCANIMFRELRNSTHDFSWQLLSEYKRIAPLRTMKDHLAEQQKQNEGTENPTT